MRAHWLILTGACLAFLAAAWWHIALPGPDYDECMGAAPAVNFVRGTQNATPMQMASSVVEVFGRPLPMMLMTYIGPVKTLAYVPLLTVLGSGVVSLRLLPTLAALASLLLAFHLCRRLFGRRVAVLAVLLLALDPSFVFYLTRDTGPAALQVLLGVGALTALVHWWEGHRAALCVAALLLGIGVAHKADFLWVIAGLGLAAAVVAPRETLRRLEPKLAALALASLVVGALPLVLFNLRTGGLTFAPALRRIFSSERSSPTRLQDNAAERARQVWELLDGDWVTRFFTEQTLPLEALRLAAPLLLLASLAWLAAQCVRRREPAGSRVTRGLLVYLAFGFVATCFSPAGLMGHHLLILYPALHVAMAIALADLPRRGIAHAILAVVLLANVAAVAGVNHRLAETGGSGRWSDAIYALHDELRSRDQPVALMDWGFTTNLIVLSDGELPMLPVYRHGYRGPISAAQLERYLSDRVLYVFHAREFAVFEGVDTAFEQAAARNGFATVEERVFPQRDGRAVYRLVRLERN